MVIFSKHGGGIIKDPGEKLAKHILSRAQDVIPFVRDKSKGTYHLDMWVRTPQGRKTRKGQEQEAGKSSLEKASRQKEDAMDVDGLAVIDEGEWHEVVSRSNARKATEMLCRRPKP